MQALRSKINIKIFPFFLVATMFVTWQFVVAEDADVIKVEQTPASADTSFVEIVELGEQSASIPPVEEPEASEDNIAVKLQDTATLKELEQAEGDAEDTETLDSYDSVLSDDVVEDTDGDKPPESDDSTDSANTDVETEQETVPPAPAPDNTNNENNVTEIIPENNIDPDLLNVDLNKEDEILDNIMEIAPLEQLLDQKYIFSLSGIVALTQASIAKIIARGAIVSTDPLLLERVPEIVINETRNALEVRGECTEFYYVILLYAHEDDYLNDPGSYLVNRAFLCLSGTYSFTLDQLPNSLLAGDYYLLIGAQGETGTWVPQSAITKVQIGIRE